MKLNKLTLIAFILSVSPLMSLDAMAHTSVQHISHLATVLDKQKYDKKPTVATVNALPNDVVDIEVNGKEIDLAWNLTVAKRGDGGADKEEKAIADYAQQVADDAEAAHEKSEKDEATAKAKQKAAKAAQAKTSPAKKKATKSAKAENNDISNGDDEAYAVTTPLKWRGKVCKDEIMATVDEANELRAQGLIT